MSERLRIVTEENTRLSWIASIDAWDYCDPKPLADMIERHGVPSELNSLVASIIAGNRKQNRKANSAKIAPDQRMVIADAYLSIRQIPEGILAKRSVPSYADLDMGDLTGLELIDRVQEYRSYQKRYDEKVAKMLGISPRSLKSLVSQYRDKIKNYPNL